MKKRDKKLINIIRRDCGSCVYSSDPTCERCNDSYDAIIRRVIQMAPKPPRAYWGSSRDYYLDGVRDFKKRLRGSK